MRLLVCAITFVLASGFSAQGHRWTNAPDQPVPYQLYAEGSDDVTDGSDLDAIRTGFGTWEEVACAYLTFAEQSFVEPRQIANEGQHRIFWIENEGDWPGQAATLALTYVFYRTDGDRAITDADMVFNGANWSWTTVDSEVGQGNPGKVDIETVAFHEAGHFLGLDHSTDPEAAMYPSNNKGIQRGPATDDVQGACALYPTGGGSANPVGAPCQANEDCASSLCANDEQIGRLYCTAECVVNNPSTCPAGYPCTATSIGNYCLAPAVVDELCDFCSNGNQCSSGLCATVPFRNFGQPFCTKPCDPTNPTGVCPSGYACELTQLETTQIGVCVPTTGVCQPSGKGGHNEACYANGSCKPGHTCLEWEPGVGPNFCFAACSPQSPVCGDRQECTQVAGTNAYVCLTKAQIGEPCQPEACLGTSQCLFDPAIGMDSAVCYRSCSGGQSECPANELCDGTGLAVPVCIPMDGFKYDGAPCLSSSECESGVCTTFGNVQLCSRPCAVTNQTNDCAPGLKCLADGSSTQGFCWPESFETNDPTDMRVITPQGGYCACDTTSQCDDACPCDPECDGSSCSCSAVPAPGEGRGGLGLAWWLGAAWLVRRVSSRRGRRPSAARA